MELHQLIYFVAVAETGGFSRAAQRCNISQPSLSQQIIKLEQELGQPLFERLGRRVVLTAAGQALLPRASRVLSDIQSIKKGFADEADAERGQLAIGCIPTLAPLLLPDVLQRFAERYPQARLSILEQTTAVLIERLIALELDICLMSLPIDHKQIATEELFHEPLVLAVPREHPLAAQGQPEIGALRAVPFIALNEEHCLSAQVQAFCYERSVQPQVICRATQLATVQSCVAAGLGVSLVPQTLAALDRSGQCAYRQIAGETPTRAIAAAWHHSRARSYLAARFIEHVRAEACLNELEIDDRRCCSGQSR